MATANNVKPVSQRTRSESANSILWFATVALSIVGGFVFTLLLARFLLPADELDSPEIIKIDAREQVTYIDFPEVTAVLGRSKFSRFVVLKISLQVPIAEKSLVEKQISARTAVLRNRILNHVAELTEESISGQHGNNQLRRFLHGMFNDVLFDDGIERVQEVLFSEFKVQ